MFMSVGSHEPKPFEGVVSQDHDKQECDIEKISVNVLHYERKLSLTPIRMTRLANGATRWVCPEGFVISSAIVVASEPKSAGCPQNKHSRCHSQESRQP